VQIIGRGLIARSLAPYADAHPDTVAFAAGVASSSSANRETCGREEHVLMETLAAARASGQRILYFSGGGAVYGSVARPADELAECRPVSEYGHHQLRCERLVAESGLQYLIARLPNVVGAPANPTQLVPALVRAVLAGRVVIQRSAMRDIIDGADMARLVNELLRTGPDRLTINLATGHSVKAGAIVEEICSILGVDVRRDVGQDGEDQSLSVRRLHETLGRDPFPDTTEYRRVLARHVPILAEEALGGMARP
jgi:nucleoside-diphosphate-sugar epimerase